MQKEENIKQNIVSIAHRLHSAQTPTLECSSPFKNCTYCGSFQPKCIIFIPLMQNTKTIKHLIYLLVTKRPQASQRGYN